MDKLIIDIFRLSLEKFHTKKMNIVLGTIKTIMKVKFPTTSNMFVEKNVKSFKKNNN